MGEPAFREHASGLMVPTELSRERQVWTKSESALIDRATKLLGSRGLLMFLGCQEERCKKAGPITRRRGAGGEMILQCEHMDRIFTRAF